MLATTANTISGFLKSNESELVGLIEQLVTIETPSTEPETQGPLLDILEREFRRFDYDGFRLHRRTGRGGHLYARPRVRRRNAPRQLLLGHSDTVWPIGTLKTRPFTSENGHLYGPGIFDMKAGLAMIVFALRAVQECSIACTVTPTVLINSDEEIGSRESGSYIRLLARGASRALVVEPALGVDGKLKTARKGIGRFTVRVHGKPAHSGLDPTSGASAIIELSYVIQKLDALNDHAAGITVNVGLINGGQRANIIAPFSEATAEVRVLNLRDAVALEHAIRAIDPVTPGTRLQIEGGFGRPPFEPTPAELWDAACSAASELGISIGHATAGGASDGNTTSQFTPTLDGLGPVGDGAHARHEFVARDKLVERTALLALLVAMPPIEHVLTPEAR